MFCKNCGKEIEADYKICPYCGVKFEEKITKSESSKEVKKNKKGKKKKIGLIFLAVIIIIVIIAIAVSGNSDSSSDSSSSTVANLDFANYISEDTSKLLEDYDCFEKSEDMNGYECASGRVLLIPDDNNKWYMISIRNSQDISLPSFFGLKIGDIADFTASDLEKYGYEFCTIEGNYIYYGNPDTDAYIRFEKTSDDKIYSIAWTSEGYNEIYTSIYGEETDNENDEGIDTSENTATPDTSKATPVELAYDYIYGGIVDGIVEEVSESGGDSDWLSYAFYDIDNDGYLEFLVQKGICDADLMYEIYTTDGSSCSLWGEIGGDVTLYEDSAGNGFYTDSIQMGYETVQHIYVDEDGNLQEETVYDGEEKGDFDFLQKEITTRTLSAGLVW